MQHCRPWSDCFRSGLSVWKLRIVTVILHAGSIISIIFCRHVKYIVNPREANPTALSQMFCHSLITYNYEPGHEKICFMPYVNNSGTDQPALPHSLISAFFVHCFESMLPILAKSKFSRLSAGLFVKKHSYFSVGLICLQTSIFFS